jgi:hypothetical protein
LAERLQAIHELLGQIPDTLEDVWVKVALNDEAEIAELIDQITATRNPFDKKYSKVEDAAWELTDGHKSETRCTGMGLSSMGGQGAMRAWGCETNPNPHGIPCPAACCADRLPASTLSRC